MSRIESRFSARPRRAQSHRPVLAEPCEPRVLLAASLVADLYTAPASSDPEQIVSVGGTAFFAAESPGAGAELWKSDGTAAGTVLVKDVTPGPVGSAPASLVDLGGTLLFTAYPGSGRVRQLWRTDGTGAGTVRVTDAVDVDAESVVQQGQVHLVAHDGAAYFRGIGADGAGAELWRSDGTAAETRRVKDVRPGPESSLPHPVVSSGGLLYFTANDGVHGVELWVTDGTDAGTRLLKDIGPGDQPAQAYAVTAAAGGRVFFATVDPYVAGQPDLTAGIWSSDGTEQGTVRLLTVPTRRVQFAALGDRMLVFAEGRRRQSIYLSDGTPAGTVELKGFDTNYGALDQPVAGDGVVYFVRYDYDATFNELWKTDGTAAGTVRIDPLPMMPGNYGGALLKLVVGNRLFFTTFSDGGALGRELWSTDGTPGGAAMVEDIWPGPEWSDPQEFAEVGGVAFFSAATPDAGRELWRSDGTAAGTSLVRDINPATLGSEPHHLADANGTLFAATHHNDWNTQLVRTSATGDGVVPVGPPLPGPYPDNQVVEVTGSGNLAYFLTYTHRPFGEWHLNRTDGTSEGTVHLRDFEPAASVVDLDDNGTVLFGASGVGVGGWELWRSDGTPAGTVPVKDINPDGESRATPFATLNGVVLLSADDGVHGNELWRSDGTAAGTVLVKDIVPGGGGSGPRPVGVAGGVAYFRVYPAPGVVELWKSDGTEAGTTRVAAVGDGPYAIGYPLWRDAPVGAAAGNRLAFSAYNAERRLELWGSDGTEAGTVRIDPSPGTLTPASFAAYGGRAYFSGNDAAGGREVWSTDGTAAGTRRDADVWPGPVGSDPQWLAASGGALWFGADSPLHGRELWKFVPGDEPPGAALVVGRHVFYNNSSFDAARSLDADDHAIAADKQPLLPGQSASPANVTSYAKGVNGVMVDIANLPAGAETALSAADFDARFPPASVTVRRGAGVNGSDRVTLTWPDYNPASMRMKDARVVVNGWLRVTVKANERTGLASPDVFSFGNLIGEAAAAKAVVGKSPFRINALDLAAVKRAMRAGASAAVTAAADIDRDGRVNALDLALVRRNLGRSLSIPDLP